MQISIGQGKTEPYMHSRKTSRKLPYKKIQLIYQGIHNDPRVLQARKNDGMISIANLELPFCSRDEWSK